MSETMKALVKPKPGAGVELQDVPVPKPGPDELLLKVRAASICGSDLHIHNWNTWAASRIKPPIVFGHEFAGEVLEVGPQVRSFRPGDRVSAESHIFCGVCHQCRTGSAHICSRLEILGVGPGRAASAEPGVFSVQVGAFQDRRNAELLKQSIAQRFSPVNIVTFDRGDEVFYRVRVGQETTQEGAESLARQLRQAGFAAQTFVMREN